MHKICLPRSATNRLFALRDRFRAFDGIVPQRATHLVINMQNAFLAPREPLEIPVAREIAPNINKISKALRAAGGCVAYVQNTSDVGTMRSCSNYWTSSAAVADCFIEGRQSHALWQALDLDPADLRVPKRHFSAFAPDSSPLDTVLRALGIDTVIITGTPTNICCESTARDAMSLGYKVIFVDDATACLDDGEHNATLGNMLLMSADVMSTNELIVFIEQCASYASLSTSSVDALRDGLPSDITVATPRAS
jgi:ureidoacrylate peracid hydrolase